MPAKGFVFEPISGNLESAVSHVRLAHGYPGGDWAPRKGVTRKQRLVDVGQFHVADHELVAAGETPLGGFIRHVHPELADLASAGRFPLTETRHEFVVLVMGDVRPYDAHDTSVLLALRSLRARHPDETFVVHTGDGPGATESAREAAEVLRVPLRVYDGSQLALRRLDVILLFARRPTQAQQALLVEAQACNIRTWHYDGNEWTSGPEGRMDR